LAEYQVLLEVMSVIKGISTLNPSRVDKRFHQEQALLDAMSENAVLVDQQGNILITNSAWSQYTRQNRGNETKCGTANNYLAACRDGDEDAKSVLSGLEKILAFKSSKFEHFYPCHSPTEKHWYIITITAYPANQKGICALISHNDVTHLIERQNAIEARENRYITVINSLIEGMVIQNLRGEITTCNQAAETLLDMPLKKMHAQKSLVPMQKLWHQDGSEFLLNEYPPLFTLKTSQPLDAIVGLGNKWDDLSWLKIHSTPIFNHPDDVTPVAIVTTLVSVTKELCQNQKLQELRDRFELAINSAKIGIWDWHIDQNRLIWDNNMFSIYGYNHKDFKGNYEDWCTRIYPDDLQSFEEHIQQALHNNVPFEKEFRVIWPDKSIHIIKPFAIVRRDSSNNAVRMVGANQDVTLLRLGQQTLQENEHRLQLLINNLPVGAIYLKDKKLFMNNRAVSITGYQQHEISNVKLWFKTLFKTQADKLLKQYQHDRKQGFTQTRSYMFEHKNGQQRWLEFNGFIYENNEAWIITDITDRKMTETQLKHLAFYDPLTDLPNRSNFEFTLNKALVRAERHHLQFAILLFDMDQFKRINDTYGHPIGDKLLVLFSHRLSKHLRQGDMVARLGGDEFIVLIENVKVFKEISQIAQYLITELQAPYIVEENLELKISVSIGISIYPTHGTNSMHLLRNADTAMYLAKSKGRNTFRFYSKNLTDMIEQRMSLESQLRDALKLNQFVLYYQPLIDVMSGKIYGAEALIRWHNQAGELILPDEFISVAEDIGIIAPLGEWALRRACEDMVQWHDEGLLISKVAVNLSPIQFEKGDIVSTVLDTLSATRLAPHYLNLEITENTLISQSDTIEQIVNTLKQQGIIFSIDDFGTGYSSLLYLKRFAVGQIKIDRSFIKDIPGDTNDVQLVKTIINMGHNLNLLVLAEGVETQQQLDFLRELSCDSYQGYLMSKPVAANEFKALLQSEQF